MDRTDRPRVVVVEDDHAVATLVTEILNDGGFDAVAADHRVSVSDVTKMRPRILVIDLFLGHVEADEFLRSLRRTPMGRVPVVLMSAAPDVEQQARSLGANAFLRKPFDIEDLVRTCRSLAA